MTAEVVDFPGPTVLHVPVDKVLSGAVEAKLNDVIVIGRTPENDLYVASSMPEAPEILWLMKNVECYLLNPDRE